MEILVCLKQVPNTTEIKIDPVTNTLKRDGVASIINPDDKTGLEVALRLKEAHGANVTVISMGPPQAEKALAEALAMGADKAVLLTDRAFAGADTLATSKTIAAAIKNFDYDLIIAGRQAIDGDTAQVGPEIAEHLGIPQITYACDVTYSEEDKTFTVKRQFEDGYQLLQVQAPCLFTVLSTACKPRYMRVKGLVDLDKKEVQIMTRGDLEIEDAVLGLKGSPTKVKQSFNKQYNANKQKIQLDPAEAAKLIAQTLKDKHLIQEADMSKNILVIAEQRGGVVQNVTFELIGIAKELSAVTDAKVEVLLLGHDIKGEVANIVGYGADKVYVVDHENLATYLTDYYVQATVDVIKANQPNVVLLGASSIGRDLGPRVAARLNTGLTADCTKLEMKEDGSLEMTRPAFGGNLFATIVCPDTRPQMSTVRPGVMKKCDFDASHKAEVEEVAVEFAPSRIKLVEEVKECSCVEKIEDAKILVACGRGIGNPDSIAHAQELAQQIGGTYCSSRALVDAGIMESCRQVGQTGKTVRPDCYMAFGISGAVQHLAGMEDSDFIIAVNKDDTASIFNVADLGIVCDATKVLPLLKEEIAKIVKA